MIDNSSHVPPDEDKCELTPAQCGGEYPEPDGAAPRRGRSSATDFNLKEDSVDRWRQYIRGSSRRKVWAVAEEPSNDPRITAALKAYRDGIPDPVGAAAAFAIGYVVGPTWWEWDGSYSQFDAWLGEHGGEFAACAVLDYFGVAVVGSRSRETATYEVGFGDSLALDFRPAEPAEWPWFDFRAEVYRLRAFLSKLPEPEYQAIRTALGERGDNHLQRLVRAYVMPAETTWVDEVCAERHGWKFDTAFSNGMLFSSVSSMDQLRSADLTYLEFWSRTPDVVYSLVEGVGSDCFPLLADAATEFASNISGWWFLTDALVALPCDEAVSFLLKTIAERGTWNLVTEAADRFPKRTLRSIAALAGSSDRIERARFAGLIRSKPLLHGPALEAVSQTDRDVIERLLELRDAPAEANPADIPSFLDERRAPKRPAWAEMVLGMPILLRGRQSRLPRSAVEQILAAMALDSLDDRHPDIDRIREHCDTASLRDLSWAVFEAWTLNGAPTKHTWALTQLSRFADDATVSKLETLIREWPGEGFHRRAVRGLEVLGAIGSEESLSAVYRISQKVKFKKLKEVANAEVGRISARLGLSRDQLLDRFVPDFALEVDGTMVLDYGPRQFKVGIDERLKPYVVDGKGKVRKSLPKADDNDDPEAAEAAAQRFNQLKKGLKTVGTEQVRRLEKAMNAGRTWSASEFERYFAGHALMWHLARRLVWQFASGGEWTAFRLAEDRTRTDVDENELRVPEDAEIRLAHPVLLGDETERWAGIFADYELVQPFDQLARPVGVFTPDEIATARLSRFEGVTLPYGPLIGLRHQGWRQSWTGRQGERGHGMSLELPRGGAVVIELDPGLQPGEPDAEPLQHVVAVRLSEHDHHDALPLNVAAIDAVTASEILATLAKLTKTA